MTPRDALRVTIQMQARHAFEEFFASEVVPRLLLLNEGSQGFRFEEVWLG